MANRPNLKPERPWFSSGPTAKRPGWSSQAIPHELLGRGIRAPEVVERFAQGLRLTQELLREAFTATLAGKRRNIANPFTASLPEAVEAQENEYWPVRRQQRSG